ncbi:MAG: glycosyltransferase family 1 protein [Patescibacteria group bacterium]|jgi:glycosyltransferase involved in cell wall biosynthesis
MIIGVDIRHLCAPTITGVPRYTLELLHELFLLDPTTQWVLFASGRKMALKRLPYFPEKNVSLCTHLLPNKLVNAKILLGKNLEDFCTRKPDIWFFPNQNIIRTRLPYVLTVHDVSFRIFPEFFSYKSRLWYALTHFETLLKNAAHLITVSESTAHDLSSIFSIPKEHMSAIPLGYEKQYQPTVKPSDESYLRNYKIEKPYFLSLATLEPRKNILGILEAYELFCAESKRKIDLVFAGGSGWRTKSFLDRVRHSPHQKQIHVLGYLRDQERSAFYRHAEAFLFPSFYEGFGLPVLEALASGTPVITSPVSSIPEVAKDAAIYVDPYLVSDIAEAMRLVSTDPLLQNALRKKGPQIAHSFSWKSTAEATLTILRKAAKI